MQSKQLHKDTHQYHIAARTCAQLTYTPVAQHQLPNAAAPHTICSILAAYRAGSKHRPENAHHDTTVLPSSGCNTTCNTTRAMQQAWQHDRRYAPSSRGIGDGAAHPPANNRRNAAVCHYTANFCCSPMPYKIEHRLRRQTHMKRARCVCLLALLQRNQHGGINSHLTPTPSQYRHSLVRYRYRHHYSISERVEQVH
jgi:hypothetical protein